MQQNDNKHSFFRYAIPGILLTLLIVFIAFLGIYQLQPPQALPADAPPEVFSSGRHCNILNI